ncbi:hypothetical protein RNJ44_04651 [Nakaseomyces bracarensis]|uniref:Putative lipoate-protein ligase A n=1 Tax=Nakaseomyces bracarensis TaxID=273131 RepID=A0ABR4NVH4_9SACH
MFRTSSFRLSPQLLSGNRIISRRSNGTKAPFDLKECDEKYKELNTMYEEMFSATDNTTVNGSFSTKEVGVDQGKTLIDELNEEIASIYNIESRPQSSPSPKYISNRNEFQDLIKTPGKFVLKSTSNNPYFNLALEDYIFRNTPIDIKRKVFNSNRLLFYINNKCAVIGKNQNVWEELHLNNLDKKGYNFLRRLSGGGAVLHDRGNVNYSYISSRDEFDTKFFNSKIVAWLKGVDPSLPIMQNERGDINYTNYKISGSAYKVAQGKAYHHGTMLINSDLEDFKMLLKPSEIDGVKWYTNSVHSVRSEIKNLPLPSTEYFLDICTSGYNQLFSLENDIYICNEYDVINDEISKMIDKLKSSEWKFHTGPKFELELRDNITNQIQSITVEKGYIISSTIEGVKNMDFSHFLDNINQYINIDRSKLL